MEGQQLDVLEQDSSGEFFRVRAHKAPRYREEGSVTVAEGWIRHIYLEWPKDSHDLIAATISAPRMPPAYSTHSVVDMDGESEIEAESPFAEPFAEVHEHAAPAGIQLVSGEVAEAEESAVARSLDPSAGMPSEAPARSELATQESLLSAEIVPDTR